MGFGELIVLFLVVWIVIAAIISGHAKDHGKTGWWGLVVFIFGIFGLVFYAISLAGDN